jgi:hypothetical protein
MRLFFAMKPAAPGLYARLAHSKLLTFGCTALSWAICLGRYLQCLLKLHTRLQRPYRAGRSVDTIAGTRRLRPHACVCVQKNDKLC